MSDSTREKSGGISEPIPILQDNFRLGLGYNLTEAETRGCRSSSIHHHCGAHPQAFEKDALTKWIAECQEAFDTIKRYLSNPLVLVPPRPGSPLLLYLSVAKTAFECVLGQHDEEGKKEHVIYYLIKKFTTCEARYTLVEKNFLCSNLGSSKIKALFVFVHHSPHIQDGSVEVHILSAHAIGKLAKWQMLLSEFHIVYITQKAVKGQAISDLLAVSPVDEELEPLHTHFPDERVLAIEEEAIESYIGWKLFFDGAVNYQGSRIGAVLISESGKHYLMAAKLKFRCANNMTKYEACILGLRMALDTNVKELLVIGDSILLIHQVQGEWATKNEKSLPYVNLA
ncbi:uncharacterized protein LOC132630822 [Lycium barbarum]|uniref:uncharacterized protein LOC132630822 n=1 Tax=Lycium barbarum TaxID=112863 RepID=UPI00293E7867|nr:uncharacterized protein LOC132630822 [Lycium barbarum]